MDVVVHAAQDGFHRFLGRADALFVVAVNLLYPLQVDGGCHTDQQIHMLGHVDALAPRATVYFRRKMARIDLAAGPGVGYHTAMLSLVKQEVAARLQGCPGRELPRRHAQLPAALDRVRILANHATATFAIGPEERFQLREVIAIGTEPGNVAATAPRFLEQRGELPLGIAPETVAMNDRRLDVQTLENELERVAYRGQAGTGRAGHSDDGMLPGHGFYSPRLAGRPQSRKCNPAQVTTNRIRSLERRAGPFTVALPSLTPRFLSSAYKRNKKLAGKLNCLRQGEDFSAPQILCKPLPSNFAVSQIHHLHTQAVCTARIGFCRSPRNAKMDVTRFIRVLDCFS